MLGVEGRGQMSLTLDRWHVILVSPKSILLPAHSRNPDWPTVILQPQAGICEAIRLNRPTTPMAGLGPRTMRSNRSEASS